MVPGRSIAFPGPKDLGEEDFLDNSLGFRHFSPNFYAAVLASDFGVTAVVRLNEYDAAAFNVTFYYEALAESLAILRPTFRPESEDAVTTGSYPAKLSCK